LCEENAIPIRFARTYLDPTAYQFFISYLTLEVLFRFYDHSIS